MKLINEEKVKVASQKYRKEYKFLTAEYVSESSFLEGVDFAETELINLAIEFRKWPYYYKFDSVEKNFENFIEQRKQKK